MRFASWLYAIQPISLAERAALKPEDGDLVNFDDRELQKFWQGEWLTIERVSAPEALVSPNDMRFDCGERLHVPLWCPRTEDPERTFNHPISVEIDLVCVRAADSIRIEYDFERDGYSIKQASKFEWAEDDEVQDPDWQEVAFVGAWARDERRKISPEGA